MAHEITGTDRLVLAGRPAWHGLGTVVESAPTVADALALAGLGWEVEQWPLSAVGEIDGEMTRRTVDTHVLNVRSDTHEALGVVGRGYTPVQNAELADLANALAKGDDVVRVESAGSLKGGQRVWFLLRGSSFSVREGDAVDTFYMIANGHDGTMAITGMPTSVRVVCANTMRMAMLGGRHYGFRFRHTTGVTDRVVEARKALGLYHAATDAFADAAKYLSAREMDREALQRFFVGVYAEMEGPIPANPKTKKEARDSEKALDAIRHMGRNFDADRRKTGAPANAWTAFNATTEWLQHQRKVRGRGAAGKRANAAYADMFGSTAKKKDIALKAALAL